ncbi:TonB-dependent receptor [Niveispirillum cyanobacteriorum]|uniref:TonB-dependent receptor n=1 Tax=Niveispirillum cyanobacteriorum TaxID=1612173 RepID=A0A2K9NIZ7_9PROT|nr:TonB-dependent receptor [Niveispirillum cyanobacteriorum]AUN33043.1 TonB-dependent receptor [Niveispirillum cyanobacteriorum]GGE45932.1 TonB-dependent receptor [Niveispirillum cyanobacteriorum]
MRKGNPSQLRLLAGAVSLLALSAAAPAASAQAVLDEIIVTATKRAENQQQVPVSVGTISDDKLTSVMSGGVDLLALSAQVPSLYAESTFARTFPRFYIRGLGNSDFDLNSTQPVGLVIDEVVQENPLLRGFPIFDTERVEVLRGPQGTLFGRNTPAGTISFVSKKPTQETEGYLSASYGRKNTIGAEGAVGGALIDGVLSARLSMKYDRKDNFIDNTFTGEKDAIGGFSETAARLQLMYEKGPLTALFNAHARDLDGSARVFVANAITKGSNNLSSTFSRNAVFQNGQNDLDVSSQGGSLKLEYDFDGLLLTSITGYETADVYTRGDIDGGVAGRGPGFVPFDSETADALPDHAQWTQELRLSNADGERFRWQTGLFYFNEDVTAYGYAYGNASDPRNIFVFTDSRQETKTWAVFGQASYDLTEQVVLTGGVRYNDEEKDFSVVRTMPGVPGSTTGGASLSDGQVTWDVALTYKATDDINLFTRVANGYRAPSIQSRPLFYFGPNINRDALSIAKAETLMSYEAGIKSNFWERKARLNVTAFYTDINNQQFTAVGGSSNNNTLINADGGEGYGFEAELELLPTDNLLLTGGLSYNHTEIQDKTLRIPVCGGGCTVTDPVVNGFAQLDGNSFPNAPKWILSATARYGIPVSSGEVYVFTDWNYRSKVNFFLYTSKEFYSDSKLEGGLKLGYVSDDEKFGVAVFGRNITNEKSLEGAIDFNNLTGIVNEAPFYGVEITSKF